MLIDPIEKKYQSEPFGVLNLFLKVVDSIGIGRQNGPREVPVNIFRHLKSLRHKLNKLLPHNGHNHNQERDHGQTDEKYAPAN